MKRIRPVHGFVVVLFLAGVVWATDYALDGGFGHQGYERVRPAADRTVRLDTTAQPLDSVRFYRFLNEGNQEIKFLVGRDAEGGVHVGFDASETHYKTKRGFRFADGWLTDNKCETSSRLAEITGSKRGGCRPVPLRHRLEGSMLVLEENDILAGWRLFR